MTTLMAIQAPADTMCTTSTPFAPARPTSTAESGPAEARHRTAFLRGRSVMETFRPRQ